MAYLESRNYVHRALSAASVFMDNRNVCKIADCGLYEILIENEGNLLVQGGRAWFNYPLQLCYYIKKNLPTLVPILYAGLNIKCRNTYLCRELK